MRRLISRLFPPVREREQGATIAFVAVLLVVLLGAGAIAVDVGQLAAERAQLQNGADAAALAVASTCAKSPGTCASGSSTLGTLYGNANANDGATTIAPPTIDFTARTVTANASTLTSSGSSSMTLAFARFLGINTGSAKASATAAWSPIGKGTGFPLTFSSACFDISATSQTGAVQQFQYKPGMYCTSPSGQQIPGGWGWLDSSNCQITTQAGSTSVGSDPGNNLPLGCAAILQGWVDTIQAGGEVDVVFPIFTSSTQNGTNGSYAISGYATLRIIGWKLAGGANKTPGSFRNTAGALTALGLPAIYACSGGSDRCVIAQFIRFDVADPTTGSTTGQDYGTSSVTLTK
ncbi:pilus assembly protein TadG-related protein [Sinomonas atrocyanea]